jgi:ABC-type dipeptide/oligopeptide/nickel transport system ATPase component
MSFSENNKILEVKNLKTYFYTDGGIVKAVDGVSFDLKVGETLGIVGETGSGKSVTALSILKLIQQPIGKIVGGEIIFDGYDFIKPSVHY